MRDPFTSWLREAALAVALDEIERGGAHRVPASPVVDGDMEELHATARAAVARFAAEDRRRGRG